MHRESSYALLTLAQILFPIQVRLLSNDRKITQHDPLVKEAQQALISQHDVQRVNGVRINITTETKRSALN